MHTLSTTFTVVFFALTVFWVGSASAQFAGRLPLGVTNDGIPWLKGDLSKVVEVHPTLVEAAIPAAPRLLAGQPIEFRPSPFAPDFASSSASKVSLLLDSQGLFPTICSKNLARDTVVQECAAMTAAVQPCFSTPMWSDPMAVSPDGKLMLCQTHPPGPRGKYLDIMSLEGTPHIVNHFDPMDRGDSKGKVGESMFNAPSLVKAEFVDTGHFITIDTANRVSLWMLGKASIAEIYRFEGDPRDGNCQVSVDGRFVTGISKSHLIVLDAKTGKCVRFVAAPKFKLAGKMCLSPNANRVLITGSEILLLDLEKGELLPCAPSLPLDGPTGWIDDNLIFTGSVLYDVDRRNIAWRYQAQSRIGIVVRPGGGAWYMKNINPKQKLEPVYSLAWAQIPDAKALDAGAKLTPAKLLAGPGSKVTIVQRLDILPKDQKDLVLTRLTELLTQNDMTVAPAQQIKLVVEIKQSDIFKRAVTDPTPGNPARTATVHIPQYQYTLSFEVAGRQFWQTTGVYNAPPYSGKKPGQTVPEAIKAYEDTNRPTADIILRQLDHLPANIFDIADPAKIGTTDLSKQ